jgi:hypothetical protein
MYKKAPINTPYRRAILKAIESLHDFQSRSSIDAIRRHVQATLADAAVAADAAALVDGTAATQQQLQDDRNMYKWNDTLFLKTLKSVAQNGEVDLCSNILAELSPQYKRRRADSLLRWQQQQQEFPSPPLLAAPTDNNNNTRLPMDPPHLHPSLHYTAEFKEPPKRPREHEKWKIIPKREYDRTMCVVCLFGYCLCLYDFHSDSWQLRLRFYVTSGCVFLTVPFCSKFFW